MCPRALIRLTLALLAAGTLGGCLRLFGGGGGGEEPFRPPRRVDPAAVALPEGYRIEVVAQGLTFPTAVAFDAQGTPHVTESGYSYGEAFAEPRLLRVGPGGQTQVVARGAAPPWTGVTFHQGAFYLAEGGARGGGRIVRVGADGSLTPLVKGLPSLGDHHTNGPLFGPDGSLYFALGTATNAGVVGEDNHQMGWLARHPDFHDVPCRDVTLRGQSFTSPNPLTADPEDTVQTGAFLPFGTPAQPGQVVRGRVPCSGAVLRLPAGSTTLELVAWGFRNPYGLAFSPEGRLYVTENGFDVRGSRPIFGGPDHLYEVKPGLWYGWPDFAGGRPLNVSAYRAPGRPAPDFLLETHPNPPPRAVAYLGVHSSSNRFDFSRSAAFGHLGEAFIAQFGDLSPDVGEVMSPVGFKVVRVDVHTGVVRDFAANRGGKNGPASLLGGGGLERPLDARFDPSGRALYVVDFGVLTTRGPGMQPHPGTGVLWRITRTPEGARAEGR